MVMASLSSSAGPSNSNSAPKATPSASASTNTSNVAAPSSAPQSFHLWDIGGYVIPPPGTEIDGPPVFQLYAPTQPPLSAPIQPPLATPAQRSRPRRPNHKHNPAVDQRTYLEAKSRASDAALRRVSMAAKIARSARHLKEEGQRYTTEVERLEEELAAGREESRVMREAVATKVAKLQDLESGRTAQDGDQRAATPNLRAASYLGEIEMDLAQAQYSSHSRLAHARVRYAYVTDEKRRLMDRRDELQAVVAAREKDRDATRTPQEAP
ncbi:hypothetical protein BOTBODRAFT_183825 [Botryobasidium botryosum FD-172 SS1]|uniref:Uncharacterized protein n=1 Tax=Botryobasidium botryosum (strain FD-172 SS1) TaxID=930990 RepID=A0A067MVM3_BOTB1|nr:hypothetical protein BOTBODRAFT_183825 [Botryobasidium botryosum FD-172 SS1]